MSLPRIAGIIFVVVGLVFVYIGMQPPRDSTRLAIGAALLVLGALRIARSRDAGTPR